MKPETEIRNLKRDHAEARRDWAHRKQQLLEDVRGLKTEVRHLREMVEFARAFAPVRDDDGKMGQ